VRRRIAPKPDVVNDPVEKNLVNAQIVGFRWRSPQFWQLGQ
jgi:hypothetical protein